MAIFKDLHGDTATSIWPIWAQQGCPKWGLWASSIWLTKFNFTTQHRGCLLLASFPPLAFSCGLPKGKVWPLLIKRRWIWGTSMQVVFTVNTSSSLSNSFIKIIRFISNRITEFCLFYYWRSQSLWYSLCALQWANKTTKGKQLLLFTPPLH